MNKIISSFLAGAVIPVAFLFTLQSKGASPQVQDEASLVKPYLVEVISERGEIANQISGTSASTDPFLIAGDLGADPYEKDRFAVFPEIKMGIGGKITMLETPAYLIIDGKRQHYVRSWAKEVGQLLLEDKIELGLDDKINFSKDSPLNLGTTITIIRVARTLIFESEAIEFKTRKKDDPNLDQGKKRIKQAGKKGERKFTYEVIREDGVEKSKTLKKTEIVREPVEEIIRVGTKPVITTACRYNEIVIEASIKNKLDPNQLCYRMMKESRGKPKSDGGQWQGLFQYEAGLWESVSAKAGYAGASIWDAEAQIHVTAWAWTHGYRGRWPSP